MIASASVAVAVERVGTACTLPDSRSTWFWICRSRRPSSAARRSSPPQSSHRTATAEGMLEPARAAVLRLGALAGLARAHVHGDVDVLAHPEGEAPHQRPRLGSPEVPSGPSWHSRSTCAEHLRAGPSWHSRSTYARSPPPAGMMQSLSASPCRGARPQRTRNVPPRGMFVRFNEGRSQPVDERTQGRHRAVHDRPEESSGSSFDCAWTNDGERKRSSEDTGCDGAASVPVPTTERKLRASERDEHTSTWGDLLPPPWGG